jgi:hypothetical protein
MKAALTTALGVCRRTYWFMPCCSECGILLTAENEVVPLAREACRQRRHSYFVFIQYQVRKTESSTPSSRFRVNVRAQVKAKLLKHPSAARTMTMSPTCSWSMVRCAAVLPTRTVTMALAGKHEAPAARLRTSRHRHCPLHYVIDVADLDGRINDSCDSHGV